MTTEGDIPFGTSEGEDLFATLGHPQAPTATGAELEDPFAQLASAPQQQQQEQQEEQQQQQQEAVETVPNEQPVTTPEESLAPQSFQTVQAEEITPVAEEQETSTSETVETTQQPQQQLTQEEPHKGSVALKDDTPQTTAMIESMTADLKIKEEELELKPIDDVDDPFAHLASQQQQPPQEEEGGGQGKEQQEQSPSVEMAQMIEEAPKEQAIIATESSFKEPLTDQTSAIPVNPPQPPLFSREEAIQPESSSIPTQLPSVPVIPVEPEFNQFEPVEDDPFAQLAQQQQPALEQKTRVVESQKSASPTTTTSITPVTIPPPALLPFAAQQIPTAVAPTITTTTVIPPKVTPRFSMAIPSMPFIPSMTVLP